MENELTYEYEDENTASTEEIETVKEIDVIIFENVDPVEIVRNLNIPEVS